MFNTCLTVTLSASFDLLDPLLHAHRTGTLVYVHTMSYSNDDSDMWNVYDTRLYTCAFI